MSRRPNKPRISRATLRTIILVNPTDIRVSETNTIKQMRTDKQLSRMGDIVKSHSNLFATKDERV